MATYDHKQVFADYSNGKLTPEMAVGHSLQHINKLYEAQTAANADQRAQQAKVDTLDKRVDTMQAALDRLTMSIEKVLGTQKRKSSGEQPKA